MGLKMLAIRHLEGDQADGWAYHIGQWFPERFELTFATLGFSKIEVICRQSDHARPLHNVVAIGRKAARKSKDQQMEDACKLLRDFIVVEAEEPTFQVWRSQLAEVLNAGGLPPRELAHPASATEEMVQ